MGADPPEDENSQAFAERIRELKQEHTLLRHDGTRFPAELSASLLTDADGNPEALIGVVRDVTERKQSAEQLHQSEQKYRVLIEGLPHGVGIVRDRLIVYANRPMARILGFKTTAEMIGQPALSLLVECDQARITARLARLLSGEIQRPVHYTTAVLHPDGQELPVEVFATAIRYDHSSAIQLFIMDISERIRSEQERLELQAQVQHVQKLESLGVLAGGIAHDFNNLLMGVLGNVGLAQLDARTATPMAAHLKNIEQAALRAAELTGQMLAYSGKGRFVVGPLHLNRLVEDTAQLLRTAVSKKATLTFELDADLPPLHGDSSQLRQVVMNLITNASEALGDQGGAIAVRTRVVEADRETLAATYLDEDLPAGRYLVLEIEDSGQGMQPEVRARMFDPFFSTKFTGRGLGLAAVLGIVRGHQGAIRVDSRPGSGTSVSVLLPVCPAERLDESAPEDRADEAPAVLERTGSVLVADDEPGVLKTCRAILERLGFSVLIAVDGQQALDMARLHANELCAAVLDLTMPKLDGRQVLGRIREFLPDLPVLLSSGYTEQEAFEGLAETRHTGFLQKPYTLRRLADALGRLFEG